MKLPMKKRTSRNGGVPYVAHFLFLGAILGLFLLISTCSFGVGALAASSENSVDNGNAAVSAPAEFSSPMPVLAPELLGDEATQERKVYPVSTTDDKGIDDEINGDELASDEIAEAPDETMLTASHYALLDFSSPLPILVLEFPGGKAAEESKDYFVSVTLQSHTGQPANTLIAKPSFAQRASLRNMTDDANQTDEKHDYYIRFEDAQSLLALGATTEYLLLGGMHDKSLIRNYLGYSMAETIMPGLAEHQLCEVFIRDGQGEKYQGVYLLVAPDLHDTPNALLFHQSERGEGIRIDTGNPNDGFMTIPFMEGTQWMDRFDGFTRGLSTAEYVLNSSEPRTFYQYTSRFDTPAFIGAFILGELTENYAGMTDAYFLYDINRVMLTIAPIWNFDQAFDNQSNRPVTNRMIHYSEAHYHESLLKSPQYTRRLQQSYLILRQQGLEEAALLKMVDTATAYVAPAVARDWARWDAYSAHVLQPLTELELTETDEDGDMLVKPILPVSRQRDQHEDEIQRIRHTLREHSLYFSYGITQFDFSEREVSREIVMSTNPLWVIAFLFVVFALVRFARRYGA